MNDVTVLAKRLEAYETPRWAVEAILDVEVLTPAVVDPCVGRGALAQAAAARGHIVFGMDVYPWSPLYSVQDFLFSDTDLSNFSVLMNPPFSLAEQFVEKCMDLGARKIVCFQRFAWWESRRRRDFWERCPPNRVYLCGERATCWRFDIPEDNDGHHRDPVTGRKMGNVPTAHAWFVWERGHPPGTVLGHVFKQPLSGGR